MSKDNNNLRLLGSPVNLSYRNKKKDDRKNIRNRPRSALQTSCISPDIPERFKRPFSADTKERGPSTRNLLNTFRAELLESYHNSPPITTIKVVAPTTELLRERKSPGHFTHRRDLCSNGSDYGSEDTFISLGSKIKAKAQVHSPKPKNTNVKNYLKFRHIAKRGRKAMENTVNDDIPPNQYGMEVKITEKQRSPTRSPSPKNKNIYNERSFSPTQKTRPYESYFIQLDGEKRETEDALLGRVSFGIQAEVEQAIDKYSQRLTLTKQQLSLVEEESTQDLDSVPSQNSLSPELSLEENKKDENIKDLDRYEAKNDYPESSNNFMCDPRTYTSFYDDFRSDQVDHFKNKLSSTVVHTDSSSKDSGYPDSGPNDDKYKFNYSLANNTLARSQNNINEQPKSLDSASTSSNGQGYKTYPLDKKEQWPEHLNQTRMLYKDFFLKKEGHVAIPPSNSPAKHKDNFDTEAADKNEPEFEYPQYLVNSTTKAYTSKVIEDYKKELEAINCLHELTLKDIQTDAISPTPLNIDKMFEDAANFNKQENETFIHSKPEQANNVASNDMKRRDVSKISTSELIQNYLKVKEGDATKELVNKTLQKYEKKINAHQKYENISSRYRQDWNNKAKPTITKSSSNSQINIKNQTHKNQFTMKAPLSARIEGVHNDKDIDSWISITDPTPNRDESPLEQPNEPNPIHNEPNIIEPPKVEVTRQLVTPRSSQEKENKVKELNPQSSVLDIYSMLKEIESYGDNPVTSVITAKVEEVPKTEEDTKTSKDNFTEIFEFLEKVEQSANEALSVVTTTAPQSVPKLESLLKLPQTELAQRLVTATLQLEERSCCIALLQESLTNHKEQMINKVSNLEKLSHRNMTKVKQECEDTIKRHQSFIDQLINDKKTLNHRIEQLVDERRSLEDRWKRSAQALEERYKLELRNQHDKMAAAQQVARQRWVRQKAEKIKELTVKGLEGELREMAERQQKEISDLKMAHAEQAGRSQARHAQDLDELRRTLQDERELALAKERQLAAARLEKQILELEVTYQEQRTRLVAEMRAENERVAHTLAEKDSALRAEMEKWRQDQEALLAEKRAQMEKEMAVERQKMDELVKQKQDELESHFAQHRQNFEAEQQQLLKKKVTEIAAQHKLERDREIERAIENMDVEAQAGRKELQEAIRRNKEQYETELKELGETEQATLRRYQEAQARVRQTEDKCAELEVSVNQLETRNRVLTDKNIQLEARAEEIRQSCEDAWRSKIDALKKEMEDMRKTHDEQMHQLYAKVKVAVARKDSAIQGLTREAAKYQEKIITLEQKLQQQRKDFLKQK